MTERLADIATQIQNVRQLEAVVTAMRGIAASRAQKSRTLLAGIEAYTEVVSRAIGRALTLLPSNAIAQPSRRRSKLGLILFCAEQGFAGAFSERVLDAAADDVGAAVNLIVGTRGSVIARERGIESSWSVSMVTRVDAIPSFANRLADALYRHVASGTVARIDVLFSRAMPGAGIIVDRHSVLPIDFRRFVEPVGKQAPLTTLNPQILLERLAAEYVYAQLCQAAMHAFEAENEARMLAMASAKTNIGSRLASLSQRERQIRQEEITTEIVELAAGAEALMERHR
ncbi:MAG: F0F1 ATP synthase subunit gamma [Afipia sp.]|jgi:F-type H+-transporting ATPase subunit gamma